MPAGDRVSSQAVAPLVRAMLEDPDLDVRRAALRAAVRLPLDADAWIEVGRAVYFLLSSGVFALRHGGEPPRVPLLDAIDGAARVPIKQVKEALRQLVGFEEPAVRKAAAHALALGGDGTGAGVLVDALTGQELLERYEASKSLYRVRESTASYRGRLLQQFSDEEYGSTRLWLALTVAAHGDVEPLEQLFELANRNEMDLVELVKNPGEAALAGETPPAARLVLEKVSGDETCDPGIRHVAADLLAAAAVRSAPDKDVLPPGSEAGPATATVTSQIDSVLEELIEHASQNDPRLSQDDYRLTTLLNEPDSRWVFHPEKLFYFFRGVRRAHAPRMHVAWMASRLPLHDVVTSLSGSLRASSAEERADAATLVELAARYRDSAAAPYFGGGSGAPDREPMTALPLDFEEYGLTKSGVEPGFVGGVDPFENAASPAAPAAGPVAESDAVRLGAVALNTVKPGDRFVAAFAAYVPELEEQVRAELRRRSRSTEPQLDMKTCRWKRGTTIQVAAVGHHLTIDPPADEFVWEGGRSVLTFEVAVSDAAPLSTTVLKFNVHVAGVRVAVVPVQIDIVSSPGAPSERHVVSDPPRTAFASYSSQDRLRVLDRVTEIRNTAGIDVFVDCLSLRVGERWNPALEQAITSRQLFFLFWSAHAKESKWVDWEWRAALREKGLDAIALRPLEELSLPSELASLHHTDPIMIIRDYYQRRANARPES
jgi:hypothetical protein